VDQLLIKLQVVTSWLCYFDIETAGFVSLNISAMSSAIIQGIRVGILLSWIVLSFSSIFH
jgi:hypothetical protein